MCRLLYQYLHTITLHQTEYTNIIWSLIISCTQFLCWYYNMQMMRMSPLKTDRWTPWVTMVTDKACVRRTRVHARTRARAYACACVCVRRLAWLHSVLLHVLFDVGLAYGRRKMLVVVLADLCDLRPLTIVAFWPHLVPRWRCYTCE